MTLELRDTVAPAPGDVSVTVPAGRLSSTSETVTRSPTPSRVVVAVCWVWPTTSGTRNVSRCRPIVSSTGVPGVRNCPAAGSWESTRPTWFSSSTSRCCGTGARLRPSRWTVAWASLAVCPCRSGTWTGSGPRPTRSSTTLPGATSMPSVGLVVTTWPTWLRRGGDRDDGRAQPRGGQRLQRRGLGLADHGRHRDRVGRRREQEVRARQRGEQHEHGGERDRPPAAALAPGLRLLGLPLLELVDLVVTAAVAV